MHKKESEKNKRNNAIKEHAHTHTHTFLLFNSVLAIFRKRFQCSRRGAHLKFKRRGKKPCLKQDELFFLASLQNLSLTCYLPFFFTLIMRIRSHSYKKLRKNNVNEEKNNNKNNNNNNKEEHTFSVHACGHAPRCGTAPHQ